jgi:hypothetical protein
MFSPLFPKECVLKMDTSDGWENSMAKVLESFKGMLICMLI